MGAFHIILCKFCHFLYFGSIDAIGPNLLSISNALTTGCKTDQFSSHPQRVLVDKTNTHFGNWCPSLSLFITICCHQHLSHAFHSTFSTSFCTLYSPSLTCQTQSYTFSLIEGVRYIMPQKSKTYYRPIYSYNCRANKAIWILIIVLVLQN